MPTPFSLDAFYDRLARHDWFYAYSDDPGVARQGASEKAALVADAQRFPEAQALLSAYEAAIHAPSGTDAARLPPRPTAEAPVTMAPPALAPGLLAEFDETDQARLRTAKNPTAVLAHIQARQALDATQNLAEWLPRLGGVARSANRWDFPDGSQIRAKADSWVHFVPKGHLGAVGMVVPEAQSQGVVRLVARLQGISEEVALATVQAGELASPIVQPAKQPVIQAALVLPTPPANPIVPGVQRPTRRFGRS